jgi:octaprenyl-diphosphate synthase
MLGYKDQALAILDQYPENDYKLALMRMVNYVIERKM